MPRYEITSPDGKRFEITAPEGATQDQVLEYAQQQFAAPPAPPVAPPPAAEEQPGFLQNMLKAMTSPRLAGGPMAMAGREGMEQIGRAIEKGGYEVGGGATDALAGRVPPEVAGGAGYVANVATQAVPALIGAKAGPKAADTVMKPVRSAGRAARNFVDPWLPGGIDRSVGRTAVEAAGPKREAVIQALKANRQIVPGSRPTAGEAAAPAGSAEFSGLQRVITHKAPTAYRDRGLANEAARRSAIQGIGRDEKVLADAVKARSSSSAKNYGAVANDVVGHVDEALMKRPAMKAALTRAKRLSANQGREWGDTVQDYQNLKMALDDMVKDPATFGMGASEAKAIDNTRAAFIEWLNKASPGWEAARTTHAANSVPINRMQVGQELEKALTNSLGTAERPAAFASAVQNAPRTMKRATGQARFEKLNEVLDPQQTRTVSNVLEDLKRTAEFEDLGRAGTEYARDLVGQVAPKAPAAGMFNPKYSVARAISNRLAGRVEGKSLDRLAEAMQDPELMAKLMQSVSPAERQAIVQALVGQRAVGTALGGGIGAIYGNQSAGTP